MEHMKRNEFLEYLDKELKKFHHFILFRIKLISKLEKYTLIGIISAIINFGLLFIFVSVFNIFYITSTALSYFIGVSVNYVLNRGWNFKETNIGFIHGYERFMTVSFFSILLTLFLMWVFVTNLNYNYFLSRVLIGLGVGAFAFVIDCKFTFKKIKSNKKLFKKNS